MITECHFENLRALRDVTLQIRPLTVLVGPNASGKSTILRGLDPTLIPSRGDRWQRRSDLTARRSVTFASGASVEQIWDDRPFSGEIHARPQYSYQFLEWNPRSLSASNMVFYAPFLDREGRNLTNVYASLGSASRNIVAAKFCELLPAFADIDVRPSLEPGHLGLYFRDRYNHDLWYDVDDVPSSALLVLAFLVLCYQSSTPEVVAIDEPERFLHPRLSMRILSLLHELVERSPVQIVLATQSPYILDACALEEVRVLVQRPDGSIAVKSLADHPEAQRMKGSMTPGQIWTMDDESYWVLAGGGQSE